MLNDSLNNKVEVKLKLSTLTSTKEFTHKNIDGLYTQIFDKINKDNYYLYSYLTPFNFEYDENGEEFFVEILVTQYNYFGYCSDKKIIKGYINDIRN